MKVLILGATGGTGRAIVQELQSGNHPVVALVRSPATAHLVGAELIQGDARDASSVARAVEGCDAVICTLGTGLSPLRKVTLLSTATRVLVDAMTRMNVRRLICITGVGAGDSRGHGGFLYDKLLRPVLNVYEDKDRQESVVRGSALDWVVVRPSILTNKPATGRILAATDLSNIHGGSIARGDVARFVVDQLNDPRWLRQTPLITQRD